MPRAFVSVRWTNQIALFPSTWCFSLVRAFSFQGHTEIALTMVTKDKTWKTWIISYTSHRDVQSSTFTFHINIVLSKQNNLTHKAKTKMGKLKSAQMFYIMKYSIKIEICGSLASATASSVTIIWWPVTARWAWPIPARRRTGTTTGRRRPGLWTAGVWRGGWAGSINQSRNTINK